MKFLSIQAIDKRNQNIISSILGETEPGNCSQAEEKARTFYKSCIKERDIIVSEDLVNLQVNNGKTDFFSLQTFADQCCYFVAVYVWA